MFVIPRQYVQQCDRASSRIAKQNVTKSGPEVIKLFSCSTQLKFQQHEISTAHKN